MIGSQAFSDACWEMLKNGIPEYLTKLIRLKIHSAWLEASIPTGL